ncbi:Auxin Efflux Carrier [Alkaliphilus metalliredigens QYMF]|uniref:Auxin Efflux Carrier n=1 Tax=Alkaliphilus metalliredigens (strain QYMF) TaxID=293826 RepID=A6TL68_ALKMQ|nr:AEC family transporter [Alkaliphilus metalliredigens]ABR46936.1 Auxin Efflux Carrier [Alkaliphilus metalliredigens QYMF]
MAFINTFYEIFILFILMAVGYGAKRYNILNNQLGKGISNLILNVTLPALIIKSMQFEFSSELLRMSMQIMLISLLSYGIAIGISYAATKMMKSDGTQRDVFQCILIFSNVGYMGYPVVNAIFGEMGVFYTALFNLPFNFLMLTLGVALLRRSGTGHQKKTDIKAILSNPAIIAVGLGFILFLSPWTLPYVIYGALDGLGETTTPLAMLVIGSLLADIPIKEMFNEKKLLTVSFFRLVLTPAVVMLVLHLFGVEGILLGVPVVIMAMPAAANIPVFATIYESDYYLASKGVLVTTLLSLLTIPLLTLML